MIEDTSLVPDAGWQGMAAAVPPQAKSPAPARSMPDTAQPNDRARSATPVDEALRVKLDELQALAAELDRMSDSPTTVASISVPTEFLLSIVVPVYNERNTIRQVLGRLLALDCLPKEIVVVDDGSTDGTRDVLRDLQGVPGLTIVLKPVNQGKGAALRTGFEHARGGIVMVQDADLEYDPRDIPSLLEPILNHEADVVYGSRFLQRRGKGSSVIHRFGNAMLTWASNITTGLRLTDMETCYKVFHADVLKGMSICQDRFGFEPEVTAKVARRGWRVKELPVRYDARDWDEGKKIGLKDAFNALFCIVRYAWRD
jgi:glycosyltransferase involved in cell wall biosynthesis